MNHTNLILKPVSNRIERYGDFAITQLPKNKVNTTTRYQVSDSEYSYGKFDSKEQAMSQVRQLYRGRQ
ncbi:hypothetical protein QPK14_21065 [Photorhabdus temperata subsp. temperata]